MVSTLILAIVTTGSLGVFSITTSQSTVSRRLQEEEFAVRLDLAGIQNLNDRFTCFSGACQIDNVGAAPGEGEYFPSDATAQSRFTTLCSSGSLLTVPDASYGSGLIALINATPINAQMTSLGISRSVVADTTSPQAHRYTVSWLGADSSLLRQISLTPTAAAWCPP